MWQDGRNEWGWKCARECRWVTHTFAAACIDPPNLGQVWRSEWEEGRWRGENRAAPLLLLSQA